jgi:hypothetical protein
MAERKRRAKCLCSHADCMHPRNYPESPRPCRVLKCDCVKFVPEEPQWAQEQMK